ncbi:hypothetical protein L9F63_025008, partial [Diploptera punctata]
MSQINENGLPFFVHGFKHTGNLAKPGEPLYAQVNREKKKNRQYEPATQSQYDGQLPPGPGDV